MTRIFGEVAALCDDARPGYPASVLDAIVGHHGATPATRNQRTHDALAPGGTLAVFGHEYWYADQSQAERIGAVLTAIDPTVQDRADHWVLDDVTASGVWSGVTLVLARRV